MAARAGKYTVLVEDGHMLCVQQREAIKKGLCNVGGQAGGGLARASRPFTVLSVDVEGSDMNVVQAAHRGKRRGIRNKNVHSPSSTGVRASASSSSRPSNHNYNNSELACKWDVLIVENAPLSRWRLYFEALVYEHAFKLGYSDIYI